MKLKFWGTIEKIFAFLSLMTIWVSFAIPWSFLSSSIEVHDSNWMSVKGNSYINITYLEKEPIATNIDGTNLYLAGYRLSEQLTNYFLLQADPDDEMTQALIKNADKLEVNPQQVLGSQDGSKANEEILKIVEKTSQSTEIDQEILLYFAENSYFSLTDLENPQTYFFQMIAIGLAIYLVFGTAFNIFLFRQYRQYKNAKQELFSAYPELMDNLENARIAATYLDEQLGLMIYKDYLIAYRHRFAISDLRKTTSMKLSRMTTFNLVRFLLYGRSATIVTFGTDKKDKRVLMTTRELLTKDDHKDAFMTAVQNYSPDIEFSVVTVHFY